MKLSIDDVQRMRDMYAKGSQLKQLEHIFGVSYEQVRRIVKGERWSKSLKRAQDHKSHAAVLAAVAKYKEGRYSSDATER